MRLSGVKYVLGLTDDPVHIIRLIAINYEPCVDNYSLAFQDRKHEPT